jgi:hypothetical protein
LLESHEVHLKSMEGKIVRLQEEAQKYELMA